MLCFKGAKSVIEVIEHKCLPDQLENAGSLQKIPDIRVKLGDDECCAHAGEIVTNALQHDGSRAVDLNDCAGIEHEPMDGRR